MGAEVLSLYLLTCSLILRTPYDKPIEEIREIIRGKAKWIRTKQSEYRSARPEIVRPIFQEGSTLPYLGKNYPFRIMYGQYSNQKIELQNNMFVIFSKRTESLSKQIEFLFEEWLYNRAESIFEQRSKVYCKELKIQPPQVVIKNLKNRWGSATKHHVINLNVNLLKAPENVIDCIILHELCHLKIKEHSHHFWYLLHKFIPDYREQMEWLKINGCRLI
jgi:predicted metal-dependent hydrolase